MPYVLFAALVLGLLFFRQKKAALAVGGLLMAAIAAIAAFDTYTAAQSSGVTCSVSFGGACPESEPVCVTVSNTLKKPVYKTRFRIEAYRKGHSTNVLGLQTFSSDAIIPPLSEKVLCFPDDKGSWLKAKIYGDYDPLTLQWSGKVTEFVTGDPRR